MSNVRLSALLMTILLVASVITTALSIVPLKTQGSTAPEIASASASKDVLIINDPNKSAYFGWYRPTLMSVTILKLLNKTVLWASSYKLPHETKIVFFSEPADAYAAEVYNWLIGEGYSAENIAVHPINDAELLTSHYYDESDLVIYWNTYGYDSTNIVNSTVPFITVSAMQTDEMGIGNGAPTMHASNDTFHVVNNNYYPTYDYSLGPLLFDDSYPFEATEASARGKVLVKAEVESVSPLAEMSVTQDIAVLTDGSANMVFNITIPDSPLADILREMFFANASSLQPGAEYDVPNNKTVGYDAIAEEAIKDVSLQGDVSDGDGQVDMEDVEFIARIFGYMLGDEEWNAELDLNWDGKIDMRDVAAVAHNYGKTVNNTGSLYVAGYHDGTAVNCTNVYYRGPEGSAKTNMSESGYVWYNVLPGNYTIFGTHDTIENSIKVMVEPEKVTYGQLDFGGTPPPSIQTGYAPVKEPFYQGIAMEQLNILGFDINVTESRIVPWDTANQTRVSLIANSSQLAEPIEYPNWRINVGPWDNSSKGIAAEFVLTKIQYMMQMLQSFPGDQVYVYNWQMGINLPSEAVLLNGGQLSGLNWTIDFGGGTFMQANVTSDAGRIIVDEVMVVTERTITASEEYLAASFEQYKVFYIDYSHAAGFGQVKKSTSKPEGDWSKTWSSAITPGSYEKTLTFGSLKATLKITPTLSTQWHLGWETSWTRSGLKLKWFETWMKISPSIKVEASVSARIGYTKTWSYTFWTWSTRFSFWIGAVPVWANLKLKITGSLTVSISGEVSISAGAELWAWYKAGVRWENGWSTIWDHGSGASQWGPTISASASLSVTPKASCRLMFLLYDVGGPFVEAVPYAPMTITYYTSQPNTWSISLKFKIICGVTFAGWIEKTIGLGSYSKEVADWALKSWSGTW